MGAKQSKRSVDITTTPKKGDGDNPVEGEGKVEKIADPEATKITTNGAIHTEIEFADKEENEKSPEDVKENGMSDSEVPKTPEGDVSTADELNETSDVAEKSPESAEKVEETAEGNKKNKDKPKKLKWSFRSISFSKKDKSKPSKDSKKNGDVKEEAEEGTKENATTPTAEAPKTINEDNVVEEMPITNGEATAEEIEIPAEVTEPVKEPESENPPKPIEPTEELKVELVEQPKETPVEIEPKSVVTVQIVEETIAEPAAPSTIKESKECNEVCNEEVPPPLPSSNPPSPVTVFAESTMAETLPTIETSIDAVQPTASPVVVDSIPEPISNTIPEPSKMEETSVPIVTESSQLVEDCVPSEPAAQSNPVEISEPELLITQSEPEETLLEPTSLLSDAVPNGTENVINADSLPDISTESLPSLPEPASESLPEPMSLPPVDCVPEPIINANLVPETENIPNIPLESEKVSDPIADMVLTNGEANGLPSPIITNDDMLPSVERAIKQVVLSTDNLPLENEVERHDAGGDNTENAEPVSAKVE